MSTDQIDVRECGPSTRQCECRCPDGPCTHKWDGDGVGDELCQTLTCSICGMEAMTHDLWVGP